MTDAGPYYREIDGTIVIKDCVFFECPPYQVNGFRPNGGTWTYRVVGSSLAPKIDLDLVWDDSKEAHAVADSLNRAYASGRAARDEEVKALREALKNLVATPPHSLTCMATWDIPTERRLAARIGLVCPCCDRFQNARAALAEKKA